MTVIISVCATGIIALLWILPFSTRLAKETAEEKSGAARSGPFQELGAAITLFTRESASAFRELQELFPASRTPDEK